MDKTICPKGEVSYPHISQRIWERPSLSTSTSPACPFRARKRTKILCSEAVRTTAMGVRVPRKERGRVTPRANNSLTAVYGPHDTEMSESPPGQGGTAGDSSGVSLLETHVLPKGSRAGKILAVGGLKPSSLSRGTATG